MTLLEAVWSNNMGVVLLKQGEVVRAAAAFYQARLFTPEEATVLANLAHVQFELQQYGLAIESYD